MEIIAGKEHFYWRIIIFRFLHHLPAEKPELVLLNKIYSMVCEVVNQRWDTQFVPNALYD